MNVSWQKATWSRIILNIEGKIKHLNIKTRMKNAVGHNDYSNLWQKWKSRNVWATLKTNQRDTVIFITNDFEKIFIDPDGDTYSSIII